jgi:hypothetical protein
MKRVFKGLLMAIGCPHPITLDIKQNTLIKRLSPKPNFFEHSMRLAGESIRS